MPRAPFDHSSARMDCAAGRATWAQSSKSRKIDHRAPGAGHKEDALRIVPTPPPSIYRYRVRPARGSGPVLRPSDYFSAPAYFLSHFFFSLFLYFIDRSSCPLRGAVCCAASVFLVCAAVKRLIGVAALFCRPAAAGQAKPLCARSTWMQRFFSFDLKSERAFFQAVTLKSYLQ